MSQELESVALPSGPALTPAAPESMDMSMRADADVPWANPDALTRAQLIRVHALSVALNTSARYTDPRVPAVIAAAAVVADGTTPDWAQGEAVPS